MPYNDDRVRLVTESVFSIFLGVEAPELVTLGNNVLKLEEERIRDLTEDSAGWLSARDFWGVIGGGEDMLATIYTFAVAE